MSLIQTTCKRCGSGLVVEKYTGTPYNEFKEKFYRICDDCFTDEELAEAMYLIYEEMEEKRSKRSK